MQYLLLLYAETALRPDAGSPEEAAELPRWMDLTQRMMAEGVHIAGEALHGVDFHDRA